MELRLRMELGYKEGKLQAGQVIRCEENSSRAGAKTATPTTAVAVQPRQRLLRWGEQNHLPLAITSAPERIWLDLGFNPYEDDVHFSRLHDLTWSQNNATGDGIEYVRADLAAHNPLSL